MAKVPSQSTRCGTFTTKAIAGTYSPATHSQQPGYVVWGIHFFTYAYIHITGTLSNGNCSAETNLRVWFDDGTGNRRVIAIQLHLYPYRPNMAVPVNFDYTDVNGGDEPITHVFMQVCSSSAYGTECSTRAVPGQQNQFVHGFWLGTGPTSGVPAGSIFTISTPLPTPPAVSPISQVPQAPRTSATLTTRSLCVDNPSSRSRYCLEDSSHVDPIDAGGAYGAAEFSTPVDGAFSIPRASNVAVDGTFGSAAAIEDPSSRKCLQVNNLGGSNFVRWASCNGDDAEKWLNEYNRSTKRTEFVSDWAQVNGYGSLDHPYAQCLSLDIADGNLARLDPCVAAGFFSTGFTDHWYQEFGSS